MCSSPAGPRTSPYSYCTATSPHITMTGQVGVVAELDFGLDIAQRHGLVAQRCAVAPVGGDVVVVAPLVEPQLLADDLDHRKRTVVDVAARAQLVDRQRRVVPMRHRPDD